MSLAMQALRVERHRGLIDVYRLVGLARWETDPERIREAITQARAVLDHHGRSGSAREHSQLSGYVTEAERILTDVARRQKYVVSLRRALAGEPASHFAPNAGLSHDEQIPVV